MKTRECDAGGAVRLPKQFYERPLTLEESRFASEHISIVYRYKRKYNEQHPKGYDAYRVDKCIYIIRGAKVK